MPPPPPPQSAYPDPHISAGKMLTPPCQIFLTNRQIYIKERERKSAKERWVIEKSLTCGVWCCSTVHTEHKTEPVGVSYYRNGMGLIEYICRSLSGVYFE
jgi:hypothetical protein